MTYRGEFVRRRGEASEGEGEESVRRQLHGGAKRRRHGGAKRRRQEAARRGRRAARTREEVKYRKEGRQKRAERTGGCGRRCTEAEHGCSWRGHGGGCKKRAAEELNLPPLTLIGAASTDRESGAGGQSRRPDGGVEGLGRGPDAGGRGRGRRPEPGAECRTPNAECRMPNAGTEDGCRASGAAGKDRDLRSGAGNRSRGPESGPKRRFGYASRRCLSIPAPKGRRTPTESMRPASRMPPFESK